MINIEFYKNLKKSLESDLFNEILLSKGDIDSEARRFFIVKSLYFLISTRDFDSFEKYMDCYYRDTFPYSFLKEKNNLTDDEVKNLVYNNFIQNGFLFHITPGENVEEILTTGLLALNDKYNCDLYKKSLALNETYSKIRSRNTIPELFKMHKLVNIPGLDKYQEDRFNTVYMSSNLDYVLKTYGESGELFRFFIRDLLWVFNRTDDVDTLSKSELKDKVISIIKNSKATIYDEEINQLLDFIDTIYEEKKKHKIGNLFY